jgi:hypothetical protein
LLLATDSVLFHIAQPSVRISSPVLAFSPFAKKSRPGRRLPALLLPPPFGPSPHLSLFPARIAAVAAVLAAAPIATLAPLAVLNSPAATTVVLVFLLLALPSWAHPMPAALPLLALVVELVLLLAAAYQVAYTSFLLS